ncbi:AAA family ATPase [Anatilimnocola floriformis]|uniref:AAA family ATPase n=1 Tax=Anatilimnocola floriformis TaxID=2948575 RepID=UPI0020C45ADA|nr:AAA family ATPase [Anatilimnocola floriformis]
MTAVATPPPQGNLLASILSEDSFRPAEPRKIEETGLTAALVETLILKYLTLLGSASGRQIADQVCINYLILEPIFNSLRQRQLVIHGGAAQLNDYVYTLTDQGRARAKAAMEQNAYIGAAPVPLEDYIVSVEAQTIRAEAPQKRQLQKAFSDITVEQQMLDMLGPAVNSGAGLFLYGAPGNGKTTLAKRITACYGQTIWIPKAITEDGQYIKLYDAAFHEPIEQAGNTLLKTADYDRRWIKIRRPTVVVGGELTMDALEIRHDPRSNVSEASLQMKSNCGSLLIDDFGRQRMAPIELLNRWIVPLENRIDFLTLATGKKIQVPFEQLIIFSTNLQPKDLADEAFLRRIPYKIEVKDPGREEFHLLFKIGCKGASCEFKPEVVDHLIEKHYKPARRPLRRCQPRDLLNQVRNYCVYNGIPVEMRPEYFDRVVPSYFTVVSGG